MKGGASKRANRETDRLSLVTAGLASPSFNGGRMARLDEDMTAAEWARQERYDAAEFERSEELRYRFREDCAPTTEGD